MGRRFGKTTVIKVVGGEVEYRFADNRKTDLVRKVEHFGQAVRDWSPVFQAFGPYMLRSISRNFEAEGRPGRWAPLRPATIRERIREGYGAGPILVRTGRLKRGFRFEARPRTFRLFNRVPYYPHHQYGAPRANIPRRQMVVLLRQDQAEFTKIARKHLGVEE